MINKKSEAQPLKYGSVYTPQPLADFVAHLLFAVAKLRKRKLTQVLDPACGEGALLDAIKRVEASVPVIGIDRDPEIERSVRQYDFIRDDFLLPSKVNGDLTWRYWQKKLKVISAIIANPPWSSDRVYSSEKLLSAGFSLAKGQYDCYVLFLELALQLLPVGGVYAFIIPDSLFSDQNTPLRQLILLQSEVKVVARLGEKIFPSVARAASIVVGMKKTPTPHTLTRCFRLNTEDRNSFLSGNLDLRFTRRRL